MNEGHPIDDDDVVEMTVSASPRKPTFLQRERWKAVQQAQRSGLSVRGMARELGIHRHTVRRYIDGEGPLLGGRRGRHQIPSRSRQRTFLLNN